jgi:hypothetical protein
MEDPSLAATGSTKGGPESARADRGLASSLLLSAPRLVSPDSAVEKAPSPPPALDVVVASVHRPPTAKPETRRPQGPGTAQARPRPAGHHLVVSAGVTKPAKGSSRRPPPTGARRPTRKELLRARKHASAEKGPRAAPVHRGSPGQGRTLLLGPRAVSSPLDEPIALPAPSRKRKGACKGDEPETNAERSAATQRRRVDALVAEFPREVLDRALGGQSARLQAPDQAIQRHNWEALAHLTAHARQLGHSRPSRRARAPRRPLVSTVWCVCDYV